MSGRWCNLFLLMFITAVDDETDNLLFNLGNHVNKTFFENGCPPITKTFERYLFDSEEQYTFVPHYTVVESNLEQEGNIYVWVEDIKSFNFRFYGAKHPGFFNYNFNVTLNEILRCTDSSNCERMNECYIGILNVNASELSTKTMFVTWRARKKHTTILFQHKDKVIKCEDFDSFPVHKLVLEGTKIELVKTKRNEHYAYITEEQNFYIIAPANVASVSMQIFFCQKCEFQVNLICDSVINTTFIGINSLPDLIFSNNVNVKGWTQLVLNKPSNLIQSNCFFSSVLYVVDSSEDYLFWGIIMLDYSKNRTEHTNILLNKSKTESCSQEAHDIEKCTAHQSKKLQELEVVTQELETCRKSKTTSTSESPHENDQNKTLKINPVFWKTVVMLLIMPFLQKLF